MLKGFCAQPRDSLQRDAAAERSIRVAVFNYIARQRRVESGDACKQGGRGGIDVDADSVDAILDNRIETLGQLALVDVVLILTNADGFGIDLDQLRERILQSARN